MKIIDVNEIIQVSGGMLQFNGCTMDVPEDGISKEYYQIIDVAFNRLINHKITGLEFFRQMSFVPQKDELTYFIHVDSLTWQCPI